MMRSWLIGLCLAGAAWGAERAPDVAQPVVKLPAVSVEASRNGDFCIRIDANPPKDIPPRRLWLITAVNAWPGMVRYRGKGVRHEDEIVSIDGRAVADLPPGECIHVFHRAFKKVKGQWIAQIEVRAKGEQGTRKITLIETGVGLQVVTPPKESLLPAQKE
jgi:hypothetical protein